MSTKNNATLTKAVLHLRESIDAEWLQNIAIEGKPGSTGATGPQGLKGKDGKTYTPVLREVDGEVFVDFATDENVVVGTINIKGANGVDGVNGIDGVDGKTYTPVLREEDGKVYLDFVEGDTTISGAVNLKGEKGADGAKGDTGADGKSAYDIAVENGYEGTEETYTALVTSVPENAQKAEDAKDQAVEARDEAVVALNNGCLYTPFASNHIITTTETDDDGNTITVYTLKPSKEKTLFSFNDFVSNSKIKIDWSNFSGLWNEMIVVWIRGFIWDTAIENIIFDESIKWLGSTPSLTTNSETLLAITWNPRLPSASLANVQYERRTITGEPL